VEVIAFVFAGAAASRRTAVVEGSGSKSILNETFGEVEARLVDLRFGS
jgi:hypothetical protein